MSESIKILMNEAKFDNVNELIKEIEKIDPDFYTNKRTGKFDYERYERDEKGYSNKGDIIPNFMCLVKNLAESKGMKTSDLMLKMQKFKNIFDVVSLDEIKKASVSCILASKFRTVEALKEVVERREERKKGIFWE